MIHCELGSIFEPARRYFDFQGFSVYPILRDRVQRLADYLELNDNELFLTPGSDSAIRRICHFIVQQKDWTKVILQSPNYGAWEDEFRNSSYAIQRIGIHEEGPTDQFWRLVESADGAQRAVVVVSVPNGPAGGSLSPQQVTVLQEICQFRGHLLVIDGAYQAFRGGLNDLLKRAGQSVLVIQTFSKSHGLAGLRLGVVAGDRNLLLKMGFHHAEQSVSDFSLGAMEAAIENQSLLATIWADIIRSRENAQTTLAQLGLLAWPSSGNFVTMRLQDAASAAEFVKSASVIGIRVRNLSTVVQPAGYVRFTVTDEPLMQEVMRALLECLPHSMEVG